ncbi:hypothetical protein Cantr_06893 [Candida viswanathii]|uniref:Cell wall protein RHD3 n=1 Tax=Candida viswanathii TaxID=5486 RepID=A0A367XX50_9ASCO|nr:hypothetical protein Cantr_06893 [Candida viswanathii]
MKFSIIAVAFTLAQSAFSLRAIKLKTFGFPPQSTQSSPVNLPLSSTRVLDSTTRSSIRGQRRYVGKFYFCVGEPHTEFLFTSMYATPFKVEIDEYRFLTFNGSDTIKAVKNVDDSYHNSDKYYALVQYKDGDAPDGAVPVFFQAIDA